MKAPSDFTQFEKQAVISAHLARVELLNKHASERRKWAEERGRLWQKYLAAAISLERQARHHRERAHQLQQCA